MTASQWEVAHRDAFIGIRLHWTLKGKDLLCTLFQHFVSNCQPFSSYQDVLNQGRVGPKPWQHCFEVYSALSFILLVFQKTFWVFLCQFEFPIEIYFYHCTRNMCLQCHIISRMHVWLYPLSQKLIVSHHFKHMQQTQPNAKRHNYEWNTAPGTTFRWKSENWRIFRPRALVHVQYSRWRKMFFILSIHI